MQIELDSQLGKAFGFTSDKFDGWLWKHGKVIYISFIISKQPGKGNLARLFDAIWAQGYTIKVPTPTTRMLKICAKKGFTYQKEYDKTFRENVDILVGKPRAPTITKDKHAKPAG